MSGTMNSMTIPRRPESTLENMPDLTDEKLRTIVAAVRCPDHGKAPGLLKVEDNWQIRGCCKQVVAVATQAVQNAIIKA